MNIWRNITGKCDRNIFAKVSKIFIIALWDCIAWYTLCYATIRYFVRISLRYWNNFWKSCTEIFCWYVSWYLNFKIDISSSLLSRWEIMETPILEISDGKIRGMVMNNYDNEKIYGFLGIPFAKAPVGNLRFKVSF